MEEKFTKSYAIKRIAELTEENEVLRNDVKFFKNEYQIRINTYKSYYEKQLAEKDKDIVKLNSIAKNNKTIAMLVSKEKPMFAIGELEKVKKYIENHKLKIDYGRYVVYRKSLLDNINEQIKILKEQ